MLTTGESHIIFGYVSLGSLFGLMPFQVDWKTGRFRKLSELKEFTWYFLYYFTLTHTLFSVAHFLYSRMMGPSLPLPLIITQSTFAFNPSVYMSVMTWEEVRQRGLLFQILNELYTEGELSNCITCLAA